MTKCNRLLCAASVMALGMSSAAFAQDETQSDERIVVTGSRVVTTANSPTPVTVVETEQLQATTPTTVAEGLNKLPIFSGSITGREQTGGGSYQGNALNLRNFGTARTLTLFDGRRVTPTSSSGSVDTNTLPQMLMERVDVVTGGASAVYGSDAITGVVNFVLDKDFTGIRYNVSGGFNFNDAKNFAGTNVQVGLAAGTPIAGGRGHVEGSVRYFYREPVSMLDLEYGPDYWAVVGSPNDPNNPAILVKDTRNGWSSGGFVSSCGDGCDAQGLNFNSPGILGGFNPGLPTGFGFVRQGGDGGYAVNPTAQNGLRNLETFLRASYDVSPDVTAFVQGTYVKSEYLSRYFDVNIDTGVDQNVFFKDNPFLPQVTQDLLNTGTGNTFTIEKIFNDMPALQNGGTNNLYSVTAGLEGTAGRFNWEVYYTHGQSELKVTNYRNVNNALLMAAQDAVVDPESGRIVCYVSTVPEFAALYPGCEPVNPFGEGTTSLTSLEFWAPNTYFLETNTMDDVGASIAGDLFDLPAGPLVAALSANFRHNTLEVESPSGAASTPVDCTGLRLCPEGGVKTWAFASLAPLDKVSRDVWEVAGEVNIPVLADVPMVESLDVTLAGRYTKYSGSDAVQTWKVGVDYDVVPGVRLRGTTSVDIRAPSLVDLFGPFQSSVAFFVDEHTGTEGNTSFQTAGGNPDLVPEESRTWTGGIVLTPMFAPGLTLSADYYNIKMDNALTLVQGVSVQGQCEDTAPTYDSPFCDFFIRPLPYTDTSPANYPTLVLAQLINAANQEIAGWDFEASYSTDLAGGFLNIRQLVNYQPTNVVQPISFNPPYYPSTSDVRSTTIVTYSFDDWTISAQNQWLSGWDKQTTDAPQYYGDEPRVRAFNSLDLNVNRRVDFGGGEMNLFFTVNNLFNDPGPLWGGLAGAPGFQYPVGGALTITGGNNRDYPILGRTVYFGIKGEF